MYLLIPSAPRSTLFPYTTLFRSQRKLAEPRFGSGSIKHLNLMTVELLPTNYLRTDRKSTRLNSSHTVISYAVFCLKKKIVDVLKLCVPRRRGSHVATAERLGSGN